MPSWNALVEKAEDYGVLRRNDSRISSDSREFELVEESMSPFELNVDLTRLGLEAIVQVRHFVKVEKRRLYVISF